MRNRMPAEDDVAEEAAAQVTGRRHHPAHADQRADLLGVSLRARTGADHLLQRDDVRVDRADDLGDALRIGAAIEAAAAMDVVGGDTQRAPVAVGHSGSW